jgi:hypothetical protein
MYIMFLLDPHTELKFWWPPLRDYLESKKGFEDWRDAIVADDFQLFLSDFLFDREGIKFQKHFRKVIY